MPPKRRATRRGGESSPTQAKIKEPPIQEKSEQTTSKRALRNQSKIKSNAEPYSLTRSTEILLATRQKESTVAEPRVYNLRPRKEPPNPSQRKLEPNTKKAVKSRAPAKSRLPVATDSSRSLAKVPKEQHQTVKKPSRNPIGDWVEQVSEVLPVEESSFREELLSIENFDFAAWYRARGLQPPSDMASTVRNGSAGPVNGGSKKSEPGSTQVKNTEKILRSRNIVLKRSTDVNRAEILEMIRKKRPDIISKVEEEGWQADIRKSQEGKEIIFQHTIMMEVVNRYQFNDILDWNCEQAWDCERMPQKIRIARPTSLMPMPKPDLVVGFQTESLFPSVHDMQELEGVEGYMCPEKSGSIRAFPFFAMEVKGERAGDANSTAARQNLNTASQALHNIYMFMKEAGQTNIFWEKVRFYSATATALCFIVRVHRAVKVERSLIRKGYPLSFEYDEIFSAGRLYSRKEVSGVVQNILFEYGVKELFPILRNSVKIMVQNIENEKSEEEGPTEEEQQQNGESLVEERQGEDEPSTGEQQGESSTQSSRKRGAVEPSASFSSDSRKRLHSLHI